MKSLVINNFVDSKIRAAIVDNKNIIEILVILRERNDRTKNSTLAPDFKRYLIFFTQKRMIDLIRISNNDRFSNLPNSKILNLIKLMDKINGLKEIEISAKKALDPSRLLPPSTINGDWKVKEERFLGDSDFMK